MPRPAYWPATPPELTDGVVRLRIATEPDIDAIIAACQDPSIAYWTVVPSPYFREHAEHFVRSASIEYDAGTRIPYVIADAATDQLIGSAGIHDIDLVACSGEAGYWLAPGWRGRGVAARALRLQLGVAAAFGLRQVVLRIHRDNHPSQAVARAAGCYDSGVTSSDLMHGEVREHMLWAADVSPHWETTA